MKEPRVSERLNTSKPVFRVKEWRRTPGGNYWMGHSTFYRRLADPELAPKTAIIGRTRVVLESPAQYVERVGGAEREAESA